MTTSFEESDPVVKDRAEAVRRLEIIGTLDRHAVEALRLEIRRLSKRYGVDIKEFRIERVEADASA